MGYQVLDPKDLVLSADSTVTPLWSNYKTTLTTFVTSSTQVSSSAGAFYYTIYNTSSISEREPQFYIAYGDKQGSGSLWYNPLIDGLSPTRTIYGQYRTLLYGDENANFVFGDTYTAESVFILNIERSRYKEKLLPSSFELTLDSTSLPSGLIPYGGGVLKLIANSSVSSPKFVDAGRVYEIVSGSLADGVYTARNSNGYTSTKGSYGLLFPDVGIIVINPDALSLYMIEPTFLQWEGGIEFKYGRGPNTDAVLNKNPANLYNIIKEGANFSLKSEETLSSNYVFVRARNSDFNYSSNPSYISGSTGELSYEILIDQPVTYITTIGLYNDNNDLLAVAKLSRPLQKDFTKELLVRVKLDF